MQKQRIKFLKLRLFITIICFCFFGNYLRAQQSTSGPVRPFGVSTGISKGGTNLKATSIKIIDGVPSYYWHRGCGPTALGMVVGYYDLHGFPALIPGDAATQTASVNDAIANDQHYNDYSLPLDYWPDMLQDNSELGGAHTSNCIADFMYTSWSSRSNYWGWSWSNDIAPAFTNYVTMINADYIAATSYIYYFNPDGWNLYKTEIDNNRPVVMLVDTDGNGSTDHFITGIGYDDDGSLYAVYDTWDNNIHWYQWRGLSSGNEWGIYGFDILNIITSGCPDIYEPNNLNPNTSAFSESFGDQPASKTIYGTIHNTTDLDYYQLNFTYFGVIKIELPNPPADFDLVLFNQNGEWVGTSFTSGSESIVYYVCFPGTLKLLVVGNDNQYSCDNYELTVTWEPEYFNVEPDEIHVGSAADTSYFSVTTNVDWSVNNEIDWLTVTITNINEIRVSYTENTSASSRTADITATSNCGVSKTVAIIQEGCSLSDAPIVIASDGSYCNRVEIIWNEVSGANSYEVYRGSTFLTDTTSTNYSDYNASATLTSYSVYAKNACGNSLSGSDQGFVNSPPYISELSATDQTRCYEILLEWPDDERATNYTLLKDGDFLTNTSLNYYVDIETTGKPRLYEVIATNDCGASPFNPSDWGQADTSESCNTHADQTIITAPIIIYPNPVGNELIIDRKEANNSDLTLIIYNEIGSVLMIYKKVQIANNKIIVDVQKLLPGSYQIKLISDQHIYIGRFNKTK